MPAKKAGFGVGLESRDKCEGKVILVVGLMLEDEMPETTLL